MTTRAFIWVVVTAVAMAVSFWVEMYAQTGGGAIIIGGTILIAVLFTHESRQKREQVIRVKGEVVDEDDNPYRPKT